MQIPERKGSEQLSPWPFWSAVVDKSFLLAWRELTAALAQPDFLELELDQGFDQEETFSSRTRDITAYTVRAIPQARKILSQFFTEPVTDQELIKPGYQRNDTYRPVIGQFNKDKVRVEVSPMTVDRIAVWSIIDPAGPILPSQEQLARVQIRMNLSRVTPSIQEELLGIWTGLQEGKHTVMKRLSADVAFKRIEFIERAFQSLSNIQLNRLQFTMQTGWYNDGKIEDQPIGVHTTPLLGFTLSHYVDNRVIVSVSNKILAGLDFHRDLQLVVPDENKLDELDSMISTLFEAIHRKGRYKGSE
ncbi:hypothetical protein HY468_01210 [Candidatus Roizmanbacteria bacterium]|nr:hypothetical protein [Candidatus Roizmanbacteria bacterium]